MKGIRSIVAAVVILVSSSVALAQQASPSGAGSRRSATVQIWRSWDGAYGVCGYLPRWTHLYYGPGRVYAPYRRTVYWDAWNPYAYGYPLYGSYYYWGRPSTRVAPRYDFDRIGLPVVTRASEPPPPILKELNAAAEIETGRRQWRAGDMAKALSSFKEAVAADPSSGVARVHMALALLATGDGRNADKAAQTGLERFSDVREVLRIDLPSYFRNSRELSKFATRLDRFERGEGALASGLAHLLLGRKERAVRVLGKLGDPIASKLAELAR